MSYPDPRDPRHQQPGYGQYPQPAQPYPPQQPQPQYGPPYAPPNSAGAPPYGAPPTPPRRKSNAGKIVGIVAAVVVILCGGAITAIAFAGHKAATTAVNALTSPAPAQPGAAAKTFPMGATAHGTTNDGSAFAMTISHPKAQGSDILITVDISCTQGSVPYNPLYFKVKGTDGTEYEVDITGGGTLQSGDLPAGQKVHGTLAFTAPAGVLHGGLVEVSDAGLTTIGYWKLG